MMLIGHAHSSQFMEWQYLGTASLKHATCAPNVFKKLPENQITTDFIYITSSNFVDICHINYWDQVNSWENLWKLWNGPLCWNKSGSFPLLNVTGYWKSRNTKACAKKLPQMLANNIDHGGRGVSLKIYVKYCRSLFSKTKMLQTYVDLFVLFYHCTFLFLILLIFLNLATINTNAQSL